MPGPYAHITLVNLLRQAGEYESLVRPSSQARLSLTDFFSFCELGSVSPDYPNLALGEGGAEWADAMHYRRTGEMIRRGVEYVRKSRGEPQAKLLAWLLGYCAHVVTDMTIHPVVLARVGDYSANRRQHRVCEMNQDVHVFQRMKLGEIRDSNQLSANIQGCGNPEDAHQLDQEIAGLWESMFRNVHPEMYAVNPPDIHAWHSRFVSLADSGAVTGSNLFPLGALIAFGLGLTYPASDAVDGQFVESLQVPSGPAMHYDAIFDKAAMHVAAIWKQVIAGVYGGGGIFLSRIGEWDLDTGRDQDDRLVFWGDGLSETLKQRNS